MRLLRRSVVFNLGFFTGGDLMGAGGLLELRGCRLRRKFVILLDRGCEDREGKVW